MLSNRRTLDNVKRLRETAAAQGITAFKGGLPNYYERVETNFKITEASVTFRCCASSIAIVLENRMEYFGRVIFKHLGRMALWVSRRLSRRNPMGWQ